MLNAIKFTQAFTSSFIILFIALIGISITGLSAKDLALSDELYSWSIVVGIIAGIALYGVIYLLTILVFNKFTQMPDLMQKLHYLFRHFTWPQIVIISLMAGLGEELLFRGFIQTHAVSIFNPFIGIVVASLLFGVVHALSKIYILVTFGMGVILGSVYFYLDSLILVIVIHAVYDVLAFAILVKYPHYLGIKQV